MTASGALHHENQGASAHLEEVIGEELRIISSKRKNCQSQDNLEHPEKNFFGIALSGGGIRSATINLGILEIFNKVGLLSKADYLSTVSGGGYIGGYIHTKLWQENSYNKKTGMYDRLFENVDIKHLKDYGKYLMPGKGIRKMINSFRFGGAIVFSLLLNGIWTIFFFLSLFYGLLLLSKLIFLSELAGQMLWGVTAIIVFVHFFLHDLRHVNIGRWKLWSSNRLNIIEGWLLLVIVAFLLSRLDRPYFLDLFFEGESTLLGNFLVAVILFVVTGFFSDPNTLSMHRFYRDRLAEAYIEATGKKDHMLTLVNLNEDTYGKPRSWTAPYPLINTCLNLHGADDESFKGTKTSDYFLLSPLFCGAKLTGYIKTKRVSPYEKMTLPTAMAISGAAVNPEMGTLSNRVLTFLMALLNLKLGYWAVNPGIARQKSIVEWWPQYLLAELFSRTDTRKARVNISDGGHIENLGVYELLRRKCKLIIAIDASADPQYQFSSLKNLVIRVRNELDISIDFKGDPEFHIRPYPSKGFSESHIVIADVKELPEGVGEEGEQIGLLVYIKSSLKGTPTKKLKDMIKHSWYSDSYFYKTYHPAFPHETTADQFFDKAQWEAYYHLGKFMAGDILGIDVTKEDISRADLDTPVDTIDALYKAFSEGTFGAQRTSRSF